MSITGILFLTKHRSWLGKTILAAAGAVAFCMGGILPLQSARSNVNQQATGLTWQPQSMWKQESRLERSATMVSEVGQSKGLYDGAVQTASLAEPSPPQSPAVGDSPDRKLVRTSSLDLIVNRPSDSAEQIRLLAERLGGFLEISEISGDPDSPSASLAIRVPVNRFEEARAEIRKLALRVEDEKVDAQDVTKQYVDQAAHLRNLRAEEAQYLAILKHASTVSDTLEVSEKLNEVRGQIEQQQAEFDALSKQIETVAIAVSLRAQADAQVFGLHWQPLYRLKIAARRGLDSFGDYLATVVALAFCLPTILLWLATILIGAAVGWRLLRWCIRVLFGFPKPAIKEKRAN